jgi:hypothetical protein
LVLIKWRSWSVFPRLAAWVSNTEKFASRTCIWPKHTQWGVFVLSLGPDRLVAFFFAMLKAYFRNSANLLWKNNLHNPKKLIKSFTKHFLISSSIVFILKTLFSCFLLLSWIQLWPSWNCYPSTFIEVVLCSVLATIRKCWWTSTSLFVIGHLIFLFLKHNSLCSCIWGLPIFSLRYLGDGLYFGFSF